MITPLGRYLLTEPLDVEGGVYIPNLESRLHELPNSDVALTVVGRTAPEVVSWLKAGGRSAEVGDISAATELEGLPRWRLWSPSALVENLNLSPGRALDLGCGSGRDGVFLAGNGWTVTAVDWLSDAIDRARDLQSRYAPTACVDWRVGDAVGVTGADADVVLLIRCYSPELLQSAENNLKPGGTIILASFTEAHRATTGSPRNPNWVFHPSHLSDTLQIVERRVGPKWQEVVLHRSGGYNP